MEGSGSIYRQRYEHLAQSANAHDSGEPTEQQLREALRAVGIESLADELNCGNCGAKSCLKFAAALLAQQADRRRCIVYRLKLAEKQAGALLKKMLPAAIVVDEQMRIVSCNAGFVRTFAPDAGQPGELEGQPLSDVVAFAYIFQRVLETGDEVQGHDIRLQGAILNASIFIIEPKALLGGIFYDISAPGFQKEQIVDRAREVIRRNQTTVQQIAHLLGENAADSEILLDSIVRSFSPPEREESGDDRRR